MELRVEGRKLNIRKAWQEKIDEETERLDRHHSGLVHSLRITIEETSQHKAGGYAMGMVASVPNDTVVVKKKGDTVRPMLVDAFNTLGLQLKELQRKRRLAGKGQEAGGVGIVKKLFPYESYGFIETPDGREIYFHENALKDLKMDKMAEGEEVRFGEAEGDKGPCAAWVRGGK